MKWNIGNKRKYDALPALVKARPSRPSLLSFTRVRFLVAALAIAGSFVAQVAQSPMAHAAEPTFDEMKGGSFIASELSGKVLDHQLYYFLVACSTIDVDKVTEDELKAWKFFSRSDFSAGGSHTDDRARGAMYDNDIVDCGEGKWVQEAFGRFGFTEPYEAFCSLDFTYSRNNGGNGKDGKGGHDTKACTDGRGQGDFDGSGSENDQAKAMEKLLKSTPKGPTAAGALKPEEEYVRYYRSFMNACKPTFVRAYGDGAGAEGNDRAFKIPVVTQAGNLGYVYATTSGDVKDGTSFPLVATTSGSITWKTCGEAAVKLRDVAGAYADWVAANQDADGDNSVGPTDDPSDGDSPSTCVVDGVGWIVCAVANFMATITDGMYEHVIANMLSVPPLNVDTADGENGTYNAWSSIRNIANVLFVIAFLIVVYSQITGLGISNYAIKKMLPRIVLSAILVNLSYWIAAVGVDVSNILGAGIYDMLQGIRGGLNIGNVNGWAAVTTMLLSGGAIAGGVVLGGAITVVAVGAMTPAIAMALIGILLPLLLGALLAIFIVIFILVARQALIVILIIASPLAFVAFLLPNTQQWFTKWRQWFVSLLLLYPIVSFMVGGAQIAGLVLISTASKGFTDVIGDTIKIMSGLFVMVVPFFFLPFMIRRYGGAGLDRLAGTIKAKGGKLIAPVGKVGRKMGMQAMGRQWESLKAGNAPAMRRSRFGGRLGRGIDRLRTGAAQGATRGAQGYSQWQARNKMESEHYADQQQEALLDRLSTDEAFRIAAAGGDAAAADRLAARADAQVHKRRIDDATARLRTLSRDERIALAHGRTVTTAAGHTIVPDVATQEAAIKSVAPSMDSREALDLADALGGGHGVDAAVRRAGVESLAGKAPQLTGSQLGALEGDTYSRDAATLAGLTGGKFDADWMATKAKADDIDELVAHIAGTTDPAERARLQAIVDDAVGKLDTTDTLRARVVAGSDLDQALDRLASSRSIPGSGPSGGTPAPRGSGGTGTPP